MPDAFLNDIRDTLKTIDAEGLMKRERMITSPQAPTTISVLRTIRR